MKNVIAVSPGRKRLAGMTVLVGAVLGLACSFGRGQESAKKKVDDLPFIGSERAREAIKRFPRRGSLTVAGAKPLEPSETVKSFKLMDGLEAEVVLHEPGVRQPVFLNFDERGRMWVVQLIQYPYPAGIKIIDFDHQFHAVYDRVPPPPPHDKKSPYRGLSKITIHEDLNGDGSFDRHKVFVDGLNIVTAVERGRGGVWVLQPPYLLFYADRDDNDEPDGAPVVHLAGFGMEDTHATANSLRWGPDGWLYGGHGSGCSSTIRRPGLDADTSGLYFKGQVIWRYHPVSRRFELFAEGGGNTYGLELDAQGRAFSGHNAGGTRGFHFVPGGYFAKNFGEHGFFNNPYTFGHFSAMPHHGDGARFTHTFIVYEDGAMGERFQGKLIAPMPLHNKVMLSERLPHGSTYRTRDVGLFLSSTDRWFRPVDIKSGPDGAVYIADWYDTRLSHMDPYDTWDKVRGRIYRVRPRDTARTATVALAGKNAASLAKLLEHRNRWVRQTALRLLADHPDKSIVPGLVKLAFDAESPRALDGLWGLHAVHGLTEDVSAKLLAHKQPVVRVWAVRLLEEGPEQVAVKLVQALVELAEKEQDAEVRCQLAATARRLPDKVALAMLKPMLFSDQNASDPYIPMMIWWALEAHAERDAEAIVGLYGDKTIWKQPLAVVMVERLARRYAAYPGAKNQQTLRSLLRAAPDAQAKGRVAAGIAQAFEGRSAATLLQALEADLPIDAGDPAQLALGVRAGKATALAQGLAALGGKELTEAQRIELIRAFADSQRAEVIPTLLEVLRRSANRPLRAAALTALGQFEEPRLARDILQIWSELDSQLRLHAGSVLCTRKVWVKHLLQAAVGEGVVSKADLPVDIVQRIELLGDKGLTAQAREHFGAPLRASTLDKDRRIQELAAMLRSAPAGDLKTGHALFMKRCGNCHSLFGQGQKLGPDLTGYERNNLDYMLLHIVDPSAAIREGYGQFHIETQDGRNLFGVIVEKDGTRLLLADTNAQVTAIPLKAIASQKAVPASVMPERLLDDLSPAEIRDLFAYLRAEKGLTPR